MAEAERDLVGEGRWLMDRRRLVDAGECEWLLALGDFDAAQGWAADGMRSCVDWLRWRLKLGRSTCYEKVWAAAQLRARPLVVEAFRSGRVSYSAVRLLCRLDTPDPDVEAALLSLAEKGTVRELEYACVRYQQLADQERPPPDPHLRRGVRVRPLGEGWARVEITMPALEAHELEATLEAFMAVERRNHQDGGPSAHADDDGEPTRPADDADLSAQADDPGDGPGPGPGDDLADEGGVSAHAGDGEESVSPAGDADLSEQAEDYDDDGLADEAGVSAQAEDDDSLGVDALARWRVNRAVAFTELVRCALAHVDDGHAVGDDRYLVHVVARDGQLTLLDGTPIDPAAAEDVCCDASTVAHTIDDHGEPLHLGRRTRTWTTMQRRAAKVRDSGTCRFVGCDHRARHLHHRIYWSAGGSTDIGNAVSVCYFHHELLHHGFTTTPTVDGGLAFHRPDGSLLGTTYPTPPSHALHDEAA